MKRWMLIALLLVLASPQHYRSDVHTANESARIYAAQAIVHHGTLSLNPVFVDYEEGWSPTDPPLNVDVSKRDGQYLLDKAPGVTLLALPIVAVHGVLSGGHSDYATLAWLLTLLLCALPCALFARFMSRWLGQDDNWSKLVPVALLLATPWLAYAGLLFGHAIAAVFVGMGAILALGPLNVDEQEIDRRAPVWGGLFLGAAVLTEYTTALYIFLVCGALFFTPEGRKRLAPVVFGGLLPALVLLTWNWIAFGGPLSFSYSFKYHPDHADIIAQGAFGFSWPHPERLAGIIFSAKRGLLFLAPWLLTSFMGAIWAFRDERVARTWRLFLPLTILGIPVIVSGFVDWQAGDSMGPRHLIPALPIFGIASVLAFRRLSGSVWIPVLSGLVGAAFFMCFIGAYIFPYFPAIDPSGLKPSLSNPIFELSLPLLLFGNTGRTVFDLILPVGIGFTLMLLTGALLLAKSSSFTERDSPVSPRNVAIATTTAVLFLALATRPITESENAMYDVSRAQAFAHEQLERSDVAVRIYEGICNKGSGSACSAAGVIFRDGHDLPANLSRARGLFAQGCEAHDWRSCRDLGKLFLSGLGGPQDPTQATDLFHKARRIRAGH